MVHVDEPMIVVFPRQCRVSIAGVGELAICPLWWPPRGRRAYRALLEEGRELRHGALG
jgi:hypothetical protein